jgi:hypothetical protein
MKSKALNKRWELNKKTIANLSEKAMRDLNGGHDSSPTCPAYTQYAPCSKIICLITEEVTCTCSPTS